MSRRALVTALILVIIAVGVCVFALKHHIPLTGDTVIESTQIKSISTPTVIPSEFAQIDVRSLPSDQVEAEVQRRDARDKKWEWKTPIRFYGKVIDENANGIGDADVYFQWTNLSTRGTAEAKTKTNEQGLFSLDNVQGKRLLVRVTKPGYNSSDSRNRLSFEYANPFEEIYYQPNRNNPVLFHLRTQGQYSASLAKSLEIVLSGDGASTRVKLETGSTEPDGELKVQAWKPWPPRPMSPAYDWKVVLNLVGGGFVETRDDFTFEAPETGYSETYEIEMAASLGIQWKVSAERTLYFAFGQPKRYGRLTLRTDGNSRYVFLDYVINPSGSRTMEDAKEPR